MQTGLHKFAALALLIGLAGSVYGQEPRREAPVVLQPQTLTAEADFGRRVALSGDGRVLAVGQPIGQFGQEAAVWLYVKQDLDWTLAEVIRSGPLGVDPTGAALGRSLLWVGESLFIGAWGANGNSGSVFVLERQDERFAVVQRLDPSSPTPATGRFGRQIAASPENPDEVFIAAPGDDSEIPNGGSIYRFERVGGAWQESFRHAFADPAFDFAGSNLVVAEGALLVLGGPLDIWVCSVSPTGLAVTDVIPRPLSGFGDSRYGIAMAYEDGILAVGNPRLKSCPFCFRGLVQIYERHTGGNFSLSQTLTSSGPTVGPVFSDAFGDALALDGGRLVVGAYLANDADAGVTQSQFGGVFIFERDPSGQFVEQEYFGPVPGVRARAIGSDVDVRGSTIAIGARNSSLFGPGGTVTLTAGLTFTLERGIGLPAGCTRACGGASPASNPASLSIYGVPDSTEQSLELVVDGLPPTSAGAVFLASAGSGLPAPVASTTGCLCLASPITRIGFASVDPSGESVSEPFASPAFNASVTVTAGATLHFQAWYRENDPATGASSRLTDAVALTFER